MKEFNVANFTIVYITKKICALFAIPIVSYLFPLGLFAQKETVLSSPNKMVKVFVGIGKTGRPFYQVYDQKALVLDSSNLGIRTESAAVTPIFQTVSVKDFGNQKGHYTIHNAKKSSIDYHSHDYMVTFSTEKQSLSLTFKISDHGIVFRYFIPTLPGKSVEILDEQTSYHFPLTTKAFLQPVAIAKTGWEHTNPSYEENYQQDIAVGTPESTHTGWIYPALFHNGDHWAAISEAGLDGSYCATRLSAESPNGDYKITFPDAREVISADHGLLPYSDTSFYSPWRIISLGSLKDIMESTLGTDVAPKARYDAMLCQPGQSSWSWIMSKDDYIVYDEQKKYIDFAAAMHWKYTLIDADWDRKIGYDKIKELADYAATKNVGLLLWYNSAGDWNTVKYTPKNKLLTHEDRMKEFAKLESMGIKGIKVDFFGGDGRSVIQYYNDILNDAATYHLMVNFHGTTLPRGWARTYPNLMTTEAVKGYENVTFTQKAADEEPNHAAMQPFARNLFDPMDWTPMNLYKLGSSVQRKTSSCFELATSVLFLSGIQHMAESPEGMSHMPEYVRSFLQNLPTYWDDVKFIDGYPGKYVVIARKAGNKWFVAGINGTQEPITVKIPSDIFKDNKKTVSIYSDAAAPKYIAIDKYSVGTPVTMAGAGGFILREE